MKNDERRVRQSADTEAVMWMVNRAGTAHYPKFSDLNWIAECALKSGMSEADFGRLARGAWRYQKRVRDAERAKACPPAATVPAAVDAGAAK